MKIHQKGSIVGIQKKESAYVKIEQLKVLSDEQKEKRWKSEQSLKSYHTNICIMGVSQKGREKGAEYLKKIRAKTPLI